MNDHDRLTEALKGGPRATPPPGLADSIKQEIPDAIGGSRASRGGTLWLLAATVLMLIGGGWLAMQLLSGQTSAPESVLAERDVSADAFETSRPAESQVLGLPESPPPQSTVADGTLLEKKEAALPEMESRARNETTAAKEEVQVTASAPAAPPPPPPPAPAMARPTETIARSTAPPLPPANLAPPSATGAVASSESSQEGAVTQRRQDQAKAAAAPRAEELDAAFTEERSFRDDRSSPLTYGEIQEQLLSDRLPDPDLIDVGVLIDRFDYGDRAPRRRGSVSVFMEGGAAPFSESRWRTIRIGIRARASDHGVATDAELELHFDPDTISLYRQVGRRGSMTPSSDPQMTIDLGDLPSDARQSMVFEVKLRPDVGLDQMVAEAILTYEGDSGRQQVTRNLRVGHVAPTWTTTNDSLQIATIAAALGELLASPPSERARPELISRAKEAERTVAGDEDALELLRLIERATALRRTPAGRR